jgi:hypothetical protein
VIALRRAALVLAIVGSWALLVAWAAGVRWSDPLLPAQRAELAGAYFQPVFGTATVAGSSLRVEAPGADGNSLQSTTGQFVRADDFPLLRYHFAGFPRTLELSLVFRRADRPGDVQAISLPWPGNGESSFDLSRVPGWRGLITEVGFAEYPTPQLVPPGTGFVPFELGGAELWSPSWRGAVDSLASDWLGDWPWSQRSVHALGRESGTGHAFPLVAFVALAALAALFWAWLLLRLRGPRLTATVVAGAALAWLALDMRWQSRLAWRLAAARDVYAGQDFAAREALVADSGLEDAARKVRDTIRGLPPETRVLVQGPSAYETLRLVWHLVPANAASYAEVAPAGPLPAGSVVVVYDMPAWHVAPDGRTLVGGAIHLRGYGMSSDPDLLIWRVGRGGGWP